MINEVLENIYDQNKEFYEDLNNLIKGENTCNLKLD